MKDTSTIKFTLALLFITTTIFGQEFVLDIHNTTLQECLQLEKNIGSEQLPSTSKYISLSGDAQPIEFQRKESLIPDLISSYFFKENDSTMSYVLYEWDAKNFEDDTNLDNKKSEKFQKALIEKYHRLEAMVSKIYGESVSEGDLSNFKLANEREGLQKRDIWNINDSTEIEMYTTISNYYEEREMVTIGTTHNIRLYIKNTKKENTPQLDYEKANELFALSVEFIQELGSKNLVKSKEYLSPAIIDIVTDEQLNSLIENLHFDRKTELFYSGVQIGLDGTVYTILQLKYTDDTSSPPKELIKIVMDDTDKIIGIQPIKLQGNTTEP